MNTSGKNILIKFKKHWQIMLGLEILLYALGSSILVYFLSLSLLLSLLTFFVVALIMSLLINPWKPNLKSASSYIDQKLDAVEYSTGLLLLPVDELSNLAKLQQIKVSKQLCDNIKNINPPNHLIRSSLIASLLALAGFLIFQFNILEYFQSSKIPQTQTDIISFQSIDSSEIKIKIPELKSQWITIRYPNYTKIPIYKTSKMDIKAVEGSKVSWELSFDSEVDSVIMQSMGNNYPMKFNKVVYSGNSLLKNSGFYNFKFSDLRGKSYTSDLYAIEATKDASPEIEIQGLQQFTSFNYNDNKIVQLKSIITDDYGIAEAYIVATVSKGSGESVKFREEKLSFDGKVPSGNKRMTLSKKIDLDKMKMEPGDELYFYVETSDFKQPVPNKSRSETFFAVIKDTTSYGFGVEGTLGVDRMPDYFRSQRQLIIDTEKLIRNKKKFSKKEFNFKSNELGYDQKALRLKYGEFMGEETEHGGLVESTETQPEHDDDDPLAAYTHDHDGDNEHNLVDNNKKEKDRASKNPLQEFMHDHEDPEKATLFAESIRSKLLKALNEMWDAELYLRIYTPEKSLPYQYRALKLIQEIKNSARIYVHRIGFDPPPIKEDKRLTGKLDEISSFKKSENIQKQEVYPFIKQAILILEQLITKGLSISEKDAMVFELAGNELAIKAIESPGRYLKTLQQLKRIAEGKESSSQILREVQKGLFLAIPPPDDNPIKAKLFTDEINQLLLKELDIND